MSYTGETIFYTRIDNTINAMKALYILEDEPKMREQLENIYYYTESTDKIPYNTFICNAQSVFVNGYEVGELYGNRDDIKEYLIITDGTIEPEEKSRWIEDGITTSWINTEGTPEQQIVSKLYEDILEKRSLIHNLKTMIDNASMTIQETEAMEKTIETLKGTVKNLTISLSVQLKK